MATAATGEAEAPVSSQDLLARMMARNRLLGVSPNACQSEDGRHSSLQTEASAEEDLILNSHSVALEFSSGVDYKTLLDDIRNFVAHRGTVPGQVSTGDILSEFDGKLPPKSAAIFRALLRELCTFSRDVHGQGVWQLEAQFLS